MSGISKNCGTFSMASNAVVVPARRALVTTAAGLWRRYLPPLMASRCIKPSMLAAAVA